jgi:transcriptional regulator with XRE-family HTH domain
VARPRRSPLSPQLAEFRHARELTQEQVAEAIGITVEMVRRHEKGLARPAEKYRRRYSAFYGASESSLGISSPTPPTGNLFVAESSLVSVDNLLAEISASGTSNEVIEQLSSATATLAELHTEAPARRVLRQVLETRRRTHGLVKGPVRLSQARELYRVESDLLSHACLLLGDLKQDSAAYKYGLAALTFATEAGSNEAVARSALAKTLRWAGRLVESADMARSGYELSRPSAIRVQLASQEANAAALLGDFGRARQALHRAEADAEACPERPRRSAWAFPKARQAIFALSVANHTHDPAGALRAAAFADASWKAGEPMVRANWAQIRVGSALAYLDQGDLDAAAAEVAPVLELPPELRVATVTAYTDNLSRRLASSRLRGVRGAEELRVAARQFATEALPDDLTEENS